MPLNLIEKLLTPPEKIWLEAIWDKEKNNQDVNDRILKVELHGKLPKNFDPSGSSPMLLEGKTTITLLGIGLIDPESQIVKTANAVIQCVQEILKASPTKQKISAQEVSDIAKLSNADIEKIFEKLSSIGLFHNSGINGSNGWSEINIDEKAFDNYLKHESIAQWLEDKADEIYFSKGFDVTPIKMIPQTGAKINITMQPEADPRKVFVVHGRNWDARNALFDFLRSIGLHPLEWSEAVRARGKAAPYVGEVLDSAFSIAQAIVVLFTPDDEARLLEHLWNSDDEKYETELTPQARPNVLFEAGMALGRNPDRTVLVELGKLRPFSDIGGRHIIRLNNSTQKRQELANRLQTAGCAVNLDGTDWHTKGGFDLSITEKKDKIEIKRTTNDATIVEDKTVKIHKIENNKSSQNPQKLSNQYHSLSSRFKREIEELPISHEIQRSIQTVLFHSEYPKWMSIGGRIVKNPVWENTDTKSLRKIVDNYGLDKESAPLVRHLDMLLIKCNDSNGDSYLFTYFSQDWGTYLIPFRQRNSKEGINHRFQLNAEHLAKRRRIPAETIKVTPLEGKYLISVKQNPKDSDLIIHIFEFCSVNYTQIPDTELPKKALFKLNQLRFDEKSRSVNGDVIKAIREWYGIHLDALPQSFPDGVI